MADYNPYAILAASMPGALQGFQTLANGTIDVARYNRAQMDNERLRKDLQAERIAEIDRMDRRQTRREDAIHQRNRTEAKQDQLDSAKKDYAAAGGDPSKADKMSIDQLAAETAKLVRANTIGRIMELSDAQIRARAEAAGIVGAKTKPLGELSSALAEHEVQQETKAKLDRRKMIEEFAAKDPRVQEDIKTAASAIAIAQAARARALNPKGLETLRDDQRKRIQDAIAKSPEVSKALRKLFPNDSDFTPRMHAIAVGNYGAATAGLDATALETINGTMSAVSQNAQAMFEKSGLADEANWMRQYQAGIRSADANLAKTIDAVQKIYGRDEVYGPIIMRAALGGVPLLQPQGEEGADSVQPAVEMFPAAPPTKNPVASEAFNPGGLARIQAAPPVGVGGLDLLNRPADWKSAGDPNIPTPNRSPGAYIYDKSGAATLINPMLPVDDGSYPGKDVPGVSF